MFCFIQTSDMLESGLQRQFGKHRQHKDNYLLNLNVVRNFSNKIFSYQYAVFIKSMFPWGISVLLEVLFPPINKIIRHFFTLCLSWNISTWYLKQLKALCFNVAQTQFNFLFLQKLTWWPLLRAPKPPTLSRGSEALPQKMMQFLTLCRHVSYLPVQEAQERHNSWCILGEIIWPKILVHLGK